ncbi:hypothetical protein O9992_19505 [Vibrio lentus]|nr:hypothetical protein [Vibrio lentus]
MGGGSTCKQQKIDIAYPTPIDPADTGKSVEDNVSIFLGTALIAKPCSALQPMMKKKR